MGANRLEAIRPYALYGAMIEAIAVKPAIIAMTKTASMVYLKNFFSGENMNLAFFFLRRPLIQDIISWRTPSGHIMEQYMRPKIIVRKMSSMIALTFRARRAGRN